MKDSPIKRTLRQRFRSIAVLFIAIAGLPCLVFWFIVAQPIFAPISKIDTPVTVAPEKLEVHVRKLSENFVPRSHAHLGNLHRTASYIEAQFAHSIGRPGDQSFSVGKLSYRNVSTHFGPETGKRLIVGAHYDAFSTFPAADDNASGVAVLIELAQLAGKRDWQTPLEFVAYSLEEPPYFATQQMGSAHHAEALKDAQTEVRLMISLEMLGYFSDQRGSQSYPMPFLHLYYPSRGDFIAVIGDMQQRADIRLVKKSMRSATTLPIHSIAAPAQLPGIDFSDHRNYWERGFPALMISDTAFYRNANYHTENDTADTLDYQRMAQCTAAIFQALITLDGSRVNHAATATAANTGASVASDGK